MYAKLREEGFYSLPMSWWHMDEETLPPIGVNIQKPPQLER
jgi:hypothetical protein